MAWSCCARCQDEGDALLNSDSDPVLKHSPGSPDGDGRSSRPLHDVSSITANRDWKGPLWHQPSGTEGCVPLPAINPNSCLAQNSDDFSNCSELGKTMSGKVLALREMNEIVGRIRDKDFSLADFYRHLVAAFPELCLYFCYDTDRLSTSGTSIRDEFQRTIGAFFAIYWLARVDFDGPSGFSFGVDDSYEHWPVIRAEMPGLYSKVSLTEKRKSFLKDANWDRLRQLMIEANLLVEDSSQKGLLKVNSKRMASLLVLTAIHDIMKIHVLLPVVHKQHSPYNGYLAGELVQDHDAALSYVMEHYGRLLPSFNDLDEDARRLLVFTQCDLCFNHGWFVQAEGPPGAILTKFKAALAGQGFRTLKQSDVAFYFVHWLTDLAGAEPKPLQGCTKFACKFPVPVLNSFVASFAYLENITCQTETKLMETYLQMRWEEHQPKLGDIPTGPAAITKMRLICMAQANAAIVLQAFDGLDDEDQQSLMIEMSLTGCSDQCYTGSLIPWAAGNQCAGPAFLIYYGPAYLQSFKGGDADEARRRLQVLAQIFRAARSFWPSSRSSAAQNVTLRIDAIKTMNVKDMFADQTGTWVLTRSNQNNDAVLEIVTSQKLNGLNPKEYFTLRISRPPDESTDYGYSV